MAMSGWKKELGCYVVAPDVDAHATVLDRAKSPLSVAQPSPITPSWPPELEAALRWKPHTRRAKERRFGNEGAVWKGTIRVR
jgi:hypothetical protein